MKTKLEDWNEIWTKLEGQFCILAFKKKIKFNSTIGFLKSIE